jgi:hypothetical protein
MTSTTKTPLAGQRGDNMPTDRYVDLMKQGFMKAPRVKRTYSVGNDVIGLLNSSINSKAEALKVARHYVQNQHKSTPTTYAPQYGATYIYVKDDVPNSTVAAWELKVHKWVRVI